MPMHKNFSRLKGLQRRCVECGSASSLEIHHRIFRSQVHTLESFLDVRLWVYKKTYGRELKPWTIHAVPNLVRLCNNCHTKLHNRNGSLAKKYRESFTCKKTGFNVPYKKPPKTLY